MFYRKYIKINGKKISNKYAFFSNEIKVIDDTTFIINTIIEYGKNLCEDQLKTEKKKKFVFIWKKESIQI